VISGLAAGIDTAALTAALTAGGRAVAVSRTGIDRVYPPQNAGLQQEIAANGLLISQFLPGSPHETLLYKQVTDYVVQEMNRADRLKATREGSRGAIVGFALTTLQRRLASSPEAIYQSLFRRHRCLEKRIAEERIRRRTSPPWTWPEATKSPGPSASTYTRLSNAACTTANRLRAPGRP
jgi:hypothetical protein